MRNGKITNSSASVRIPISSANWNIFLIIMLHRSHVSQKSVFANNLINVLNLKNFHFQTSVLMKFHCLSLASSSPLCSGFDIQYISLTSLFDYLEYSMMDYCILAMQKKSIKKEMKKTVSCKFYITLNRYNDKWKVLNPLCHLQVNAA